MRSFLVIDHDGFFNHLSCFLNIFIFGPVKQELSLQDTVDPLCQGVLVTVIPIGHRAGDPVFDMDRLIQRRAVLNAPVGVVNER